MELPRHIKSIVEVPQGVDEQGTPYSLVTVRYRWWYRPLAWWFFLRSKPFGGFNA